MATELGPLFKGLKQATRAGDQEGVMKYAGLLSFFGISGGLIALYVAAAAGALN